MLLHPPPPLFLKNKLISNVLTFSSMYIHSSPPPFRHKKLEQFYSPIPLKPTYTLTYTIAHKPFILLFHFLFMFLLFLLCPPLFI
ncbi:hypothetical protein BD560DRAFT_358202 [Blakeslea trispora]|nr:hypothetical protein BD560DRAFT_358202 [Blakeslea trispora]